MSVKLDWDVCTARSPEINGYTDFAGHPNDNRTQLCWAGNPNRVEAGQGNGVVIGGTAQITGEPRSRSAGEGEPWMNRPSCDTGTRMRPESLQSGRQSTDIRAEDVAFAGAARHEVRDSLGQHMQPLFGEPAGTRYPVLVCLAAFPANGRRTVVGSDRDFGHRHIIGYTPVVAGVDRQARPDRLLRKATAPQCIRDEPNEEAVCGSAAASCRSVPVVGRVPQNNTGR